jgi:hypothetical protein
MVLISIACTVGNYKGVFSDRDLYPVTRFKTSLLQPQAAHIQPGNFSRAIPGSLPGLVLTLQLDLTDIHLAHVDKNLH